jgi:RNA polymerase sigma-B factor
VSAVTAVRLPVDASADEHELLRRWHVDRDEDARRVLIERMMPLVRSLARRYANRGEPLDDLEQVGCVGLIKAVDRFDLERELRFSTFAVPTILGEIKRHFRDRAWSVRVSRGLQELSARVAREADRLSTKLGRSPTIEDLAEATGTTREQVLEALQGAQAYSTVPLEESLGDDGEPVARIGELDPEFDVAEERIELSQGMRTLGASSPASRSARSPSASGSRRCTSRACCGARSSRWATRWRPSGARRRAATARPALDRPP